ncbi:hypothetical protein [Erythrobacter alti]|uniref:hypothetical protein n=1 Tax=Erythrobacter alti TaxID=1896145 RepID=UPI0030F43209
MTKQARLLVSSLCCALLAACASPSGDYPSLAIRDSERWIGTMDAAEPQPYLPPAPDASAIDQVGALAAQASTIHAEFLAAESAVRRLATAARGSSAGSDSWASAQVGIADLESRRSQAMIALADLDRVFVETSNAGLSVAQIGDVRSEVVALVEQENAIIADLLSTVGR